MPGPWTVACWTFGQGAREDAAAGGHPPQMNAAPVATPHPYAEHLRTRWLARNTLMCVQGFVISFLWVLLEWLTALDTGAPYGWAQLLPRALPAVAAPSGILGSVFLHRRPHLLQWFTMVWAAAFAVAQDAAFFVLGTRGTLLHAVVFFACVLAVCTVLPLERGLRRVMALTIIVGHVALELLWPDGRALSSRLLACAYLGTGIFPLVMVLEQFFFSHQRNFELRRDMTTTLETLTRNRAHIGEVVQGLTSNVGRLSDSAQTLSMRMGDTEAESHSVADASEAIARSAGSLHARSRSSAERVAEASEYAASVGALIGDTERRVGELEGAVGQSEQRFSQLQDRSEHIGRFVEDVQEIAAQTHTLAVNAGIEAARAGEAGRGFSVIAREVRELAVQVGASSRRVQREVEELAAQMGASQGALGDVRARLSELQSVFGQTRGMLVGIQEVVDAMRQAVGENAQDADAQAQVTTRISQGSGRLLELVQAQGHMGAELARTTGALERLAVSLQQLVPADVAPARARSRG